MSGPTARQPQNPRKNGLSYGPPITPKIHRFKLASGQGFDHSTVTSASSASAAAKAAACFASLAA